MTASTLVCLAIVVLWVRSYWHDDAVVYLRMDQAPTGCDLISWGLESQQGSLGVGYARIRSVQGAFTPDQLGLHFITEPAQSRPMTFWERVGFSYDSDVFGAQGMNGSDRGLYVPFLVPLLMVFMPTVLLIRYRRRHAMLPGLCQRCGYNLTGNTSGVCSECGAPIASVAATK